MPATTPKKKKKRPAGSVLLSRRGKVAAPPASLSSKAGRTTIRLHHTLQKKLAQARAHGDTAASDALQVQIDAHGGLERYQQASVSGQSSQRGGDSSRVLMAWLREAGALDDTGARLRVLEIGCLSPDNAVSTSARFDVTRIDLHSRHPAIASQDFMQRPLPAASDERFDCLSLSLVLNYVAVPAQRGEMLRRTARFLAAPAAHALFPALFLVLPAPCVDNSRYLDEPRLDAIMASLGYEKKLTKKTAKLYYGLWRLSGVGAPPAAPKNVFRKQQVKPGSSRNNFAIVLE